MSNVLAIAILITRLWAASKIIGSVVGIVQVIALTGKPEYGGSPAAYFLATSVWLAIGFVFWRFAPWIVERIMPSPFERDIEINVEASDLVAVGSFLIGGFYLVLYGPALIYVIFDIVAVSLSEGSFEGDSETSSFHYQRLVEPLLAVAIAFWMAFRPTDLARLFTRLRGGDMMKSETDDPE